MSKKVVFVLLLFISLQSLAQTPEELLEKTRLNYTPEKIYIHFDKQSYIAGDTIWFKAYLMDGFLPSTKSTVINIDLINNTDKIVNKQILPIIGSVTDNAIVLSKDLPQGIYTIYAFTPVMMNFGTNSFYKKQINIYNSNSMDSIQESNIIPEINFFPEGGYLVSDLENVVAFKCTDNNGIPLKIKGNILDKNGNKIQAFESTHDGMGKFDFTPLLGEKYIADCIVDNKINKKVALSDPLFNMSLTKVTVDGDKIILKVNCSNINDELKKPSYILGVIENFVQFKTIIKPDEEEKSLDILISNLPTGILQITVFNKFNQPLNERLVFVNSSDYKVANKFNSKGLNFNTKAKNNFTFAFEDTTTGSYSISVTDADKEISDINDYDNIVTKLLLTDNLKGKIYKPSYYFESDDNVHKQNLDLVMLTNGWRRYKWAEILTNKFPEMAYSDPGYINFSGTVYKPYSKDPLISTPVILYAKSNDSLPLIFNYVTDQNGNINVPTLIFEDTVTFFIQNPNAKDKRVYFIESSKSLSSLLYISKKTVPFYKLDPATDIQKKTISKLIESKKMQYKNYLLLEEIVLKSKKITLREAYEKKYVRSVLGSNAAYTLDFLETPPYNGVSILQFLKSKLPSVNITGGPLDFQLNFRATRTLAGGFIPMAIFLDDMQVDPSLISTMQASDFALVKVFSGGPLVGAGGALALYTNKDRTQRNSGGSNFSKISVEGFSITKEFYSPNYEENLTASLSIQDDRTTLYWNPNLVLNKENKEINIEFFNSDNAKKFKVVLEGVTRDGGLVHFEKIIE